MWKSRKLMFPFAGMLAFIFIACATPPAEEPMPEPEAVPVQETPQPQVQQQEPEPAIYLDAQLKERVEGARQRAIDFESPSYFPSDWEEIESRYNEAVSAPLTSDSDRQRVSDQLYSIADDYDALFKKTVPLYALAWEDDIMAARDTLINTGLRSSFPEYLEKADEIACLALDQYEAEDYYTARDTAAAALQEYEILYTGARLVLRRQEIIDRGFVHYDYDSFNAADDIALAALDKYEAGDNAGAAASAEDAIARYNSIISSSWPAYSAERRTSTSAERDNAIEHRVNIAVRDMFREADAVFALAEENFAAGNYEDAALLFLDAEALFVIAGQETERRRNRALETIRMADERIEISEETAAEAERILEGGSR